ncbi:hypothetical protein JCM18237_17920 [Halorubrum luteum]
MDTVYIGGMTDVLDTHWSVETNAKTHNFWAFKQFTERLVCTAEEYGISVEVRSEAWTSQECPQCGSTDRTRRGASRQRHTEQAVRPMARPVRFEWDDHEWSESPRSHRPKKQRTDPSTVHRDGNVASGESWTNWDSHGGNRAVVGLRPTA